MNPNAVQTVFYPLDFGDGSGALLRPNAIARLRLAVWLRAYRSLKPHSSTELPLRGPTLLLFKFERRMPNNTPATKIRRHASGRPACPCRGRRAATTTLVVCAL